MFARARSRNSHTGLERGPLPSVTTNVLYNVSQESVEAPDRHSSAPIALSHTGAVAPCCGDGNATVLCLKTSRCMVRLPGICRVVFGKCPKRVWGRTAHQCHIIF